MENHEKLLSLYNELDEILRKRYNERNMSFSVIVRFIHELDKTGVDALCKASRKLNQIRSLRNNLIHDLDMNSSHLIEITDETVEFMQELITWIKHPKTAFDICIPLNKVVYMRNKNTNFSFNELMKTMREKGYSQIPVLNENNDVLFGIFTPNVLFDYLTHNPTKTINDIAYKDIKEYMPIDRHFSESYAFVSRDMNQEEVTNIFTDAHKDNKKMPLVIVTEHGNEEEPVLGIITLKDIVSL